MSEHARPTERTAGPAFSLEPDTLLPTQFYGATRIGAELQPEKRLMLAVLEDAVVVFQRHALATDPVGRELFDETAAWMASTDRKWPYSFENICEWLGLEPEQVRRGLYRWREQRQTGVIGEVVRSPFRRVAGSRHKATGRAPGLRHLAVA